jgi:hypothetical protein
MELLVGTSQSQTSSSGTFAKLRNIKLFRSKITENMIHEPIKLRREIPTQNEFLHIFNKLNIIHKRH